MTETKLDFMKFEVLKPNFKSAIKAHKRFAICSKKPTGNVLECIKFKKTGTELHLLSTDGNKALKTVLNLITDNGEDGEFLINVNLLNKMFFTPKGELDTIEITKTFNERKIEFYDYDSQTTQIFNDETRTDFKYPNIEGVLPSISKRKKMGVSKDLIKDLSSLKTNRGSILEMYIGEPNEAIVVKTTGEEINQTALVMPVKFDNKEEN